MNVRVDRELKIRGDEVLRAAGTNPTDIVSRLWSYVARTESVPEFLTDEEIQKHDEELRRLKTAIAEARGMVWKTLVDEGIFLEDTTPRLNADEIQLVKQYW
jgi:antitoxin component of RelBE/YafQ-DinJ toxin-antitoxin module